MRTIIVCFILFSIYYTPGYGQQTYAERLGFPKGAKVIILHVDDAGMSHDSNRGAIEALTKGIATSTSVMMPCPWVPEFAHYYHMHPSMDVGLHMTLTSEWDNYRWGPVAGRESVPSLVDREGYFYKSVEDVVKHATPEDVKHELRAQIEIAKKIGLHPTHLDTHMGTVFATADFLKAYVQLGIEYHIPVMLPGGADQLLRESMPGTPDSEFTVMQQIGKQLWDAGLPVLDDLHNLSYDWKVPSEDTSSVQKLRAWRTEKYITSFKRLRPGVTLVIMHCTDPSENFRHITNSGYLRKADLLAMTDPKLADYIKKHGIILTTWKQLQERRDQVR